MKITKRIFASLLVCMALVLCLGPAVSAVIIASPDDAIVDITGKEAPFTYRSQHMETDSDLFGNFKNVFPGDQILQRIRITHRALGFDRLKLYMRAVPHQDPGNKPQEKILAHEDTVEEMNRFLSQLTLEIWKGNDTTKTPIFKGHPSESDGLTEFIYLGEFKKGRTGTLTARLTVPIEMGNEFADRMGEVDWEFRVEEVPNPIIPQTGDSSNVHILIAVSLLSLTALIVVVVFLLRKKKK